jgi:hypothetical protein
MAWEDRFWAKVDKSRGVTACWLWTGAMSKSGSAKWSRKGAVARPRFRLMPGVLVYAHRLALSWATGRPYEDTDVEACHICDNPDGRCVNPAHLYWGTREENLTQRDRDNGWSRRRPHPPALP